MSVCTCCGSGEATGGYDWCQSCMERERQEVQEYDEWCKQFEQAERRYQKEMEKEMSEEELKACPWCQQIPQLIFREDGRIGWKGNCPACESDKTASREVMTRAIENWNRRPLEDALTAERDTLRERVARLAVTLSWYADNRNYVIQNRHLGNRCAVEQDGGDRARRVLGEE